MDKSLLKFASVVFIFSTFANFSVSIEVRAMYTQQVLERVCGTRNDYKNQFISYVNRNKESFLKHFPKSEDELLKLLGLENWQISEFKKNYENLIPTNERILEIVAEGRFDFYNPGSDISYDDLVERFKKELSNSGNSKFYIEGYISTNSKHEDIKDFAQAVLEIKNKSFQKNSEQNKRTLNKVILGLVFSVLAIFIIILIVYLTKKGNPSNNLADNNPSDDPRDNPGDDYDRKNSGHALDNIKLNGFFTSKYLLLKLAVSTIGAGSATGVAAFCLDNMLNSNKIASKIKG